MRCYCCGKPLGSQFALVSYDSKPDRAFLMLPECTQRVDDPALKVLVEEVFTPVPIGHAKARCPCTKCKAYRKAAAEDRG